MLTVVVAASTPQLVTKAKANSYLQGGWRHGSSVSQGGVEWFQLKKKHVWKFDQVSIGINRYHLLSSLIISCQNFKTVLRIAKRFLHAVGASLEFPSSFTCLVLSTAASKNMEVAVAWLQSGFVAAWWFSSLWKGQDAWRIVCDRPN